MITPVRFLRVSVLVLFLGLAMAAEEAKNPKRSIPIAYVGGILTLVLLAFGVMLLFLYFLLPRIEDMMKSMGGELPLITRMLIASSTFAAHWGWLVMIVLGVSIVALYRWRQTPEGRAATDAWCLKIPFLKGVFLNIDICHISNLCATLLESGLNTTET